MTFVNGKSAYTVASAQLVLSGWLKSTLPAKIPEPHSTLERVEDQILNLKVQQRLRLSFYVTRRPQELRFRELHSVTLQGRVRSAVRCTASGAVTGKPEPRLNRTERQSASSQGRWDFRRDLAKRLSNFGRSRHSGDQNAPTVPHPVPLPWLCEAADAPTVGPKTLNPRQPFRSPTPKRTKEPKRNSSPRGGQESPTTRAQNVGIRERSRPEGSEPVAPGLGTRATLTGA